MTARILTCTEKEYFADPCQVPSLSQSIGRLLVRECPAKAWQEHPKLGRPADEPEESTEAKDKGKIIGKLLLGKGADVEVVVANDFRSNAAKAARDMARLNGRVPIIEHKFERMQSAAEILRTKFADRGYVFDGQSEVAFEWLEQGDRGPVLCRGRMDHVKIEHGTIYDLKTTSSANPDTVAQHIYDFGYDIQWAAYCSALRKFRDEPDLFIDYVLLFCELDPPYAITEIDFNKCGEYREIGEQAWARAIGIWERCLAENVWPEYATGRIGVPPRPYVIQREIGSGNW
jgi:hypothetical protein